MVLSPQESMYSLWPPERWRDVTVVVGVSGGADSVALLRLLHQHANAAGSAGALIAAHFNHGLRGGASEADELLVRSLAGRLQIQCVVERANAQQDCVSSQESSELSAGEAEERKRGFAKRQSEESWRDERYAFLYRTACQFGARYVALAHHADDRIETILHHILRGTGISGLGALRPFRALGEEVVIARPLLKSNRESVLQYLQQIKQEYREDESNRSNRFTRNKIRNQLLPFLSELGFAQPGASLLRLGDQAREIEEWIDQIVVGLFEEFVTIHKGHVLVLCNAFQKHPPLVGRQLLFQIWKTQNWSLGCMDARSWGRLLALAHSSSSEPAIIHLPGGVCATRSKDELKLSLL